MGNFKISLSAKCHFDIRKRNQQQKSKKEVKKNHKKFQLDLELLTENSVQYASVSDNKGYVI